MTIARKNKFRSVGEYKKERSDKKLLRRLQTVEEVISGKEMKILIVLVFAALAAVQAFPASESVANEEVASSFEANFDGTANEVPGELVRNKRQYGGYGGGGFGGKQLERNLEVLLNSLLRP